MTNLRDVLGDLRAPGVRSAIEAKEEAHARDVVRPRKALYDENERKLFSALVEDPVASGSWSSYALACSIPVSRL